MSDGRIRVTVVGCGAIGGMIAGRLAAAGHPVTIVDRGARSAVIRERGLTLLAPEVPPITVWPDVAASVAEMEGQDLVVLAVKAHDLAVAVDGVGPALAQDGLVLTAQNGIPFWYWAGVDGPFRDRTIESVDPGGRVIAALPKDRTIGSVVYPAADMPSLGSSRIIEGNRISIGEIDDRKTERVERIATMFREAGFKAPVSTDIRSEIWLKLVGNLAFNPISALTGATMAEIGQHADAVALAERMMREGEAVAVALGVTFRLSLEKRLAGAIAVGGHKTSMLQDIEAGRRTEVDALLGAVREIGAMVGVATPTIDAIYAAAKLLDERRHRTAV